MTVPSYFEKYTLHDSLVKRIRYDAFEKELRMLLDFCWFIQGADPDDDPSLPEYVELVFRPVPHYDGLLGNIDDYSILWEELNGRDVTVAVLDDFHDKMYELTFQADEVTMRGVEPDRDGN